MELFIIRHAWAESFGNPAWANDSYRPLSKEGRERFGQMVELLVPRGLAPEVIATSPMIRCVETANLLAEGVGDHVKVTPRDELLPGSDLENLLAWTVKQAHHHQRIAWIGHAPDVSHLTAAMIGESSGLIRFGKGTIAAIQFEGRPTVGRGELCWLVTGKILGC